MKEMTDRDKEGFIFYGIDPTTCTCIGCVRNEVCKFVFDPYNTDGDCLELK